jgi:fructose-1,6-bisphosphatase I
VTTPPTLTEHLAHATSPALAALLDLLAKTLLGVGDAVRAAPLAATTGQGRGVNPTGDPVHRLDLVAHDLIARTLRESPLVGCLASEEAEALIQGASTTTGPFCVVFDPLDGSNNLDSNGPVASIFGVFGRETPAGTACSVADVLRPGADLVASGYALFSASTQLVVSTGDGVHVFTCDRQGVFRSSEDRLRVPDPGRRIFGVNDGRSHTWNPRVRAYVDTLRQGGHTARYVGTMAADVHRLMRHGGVYMHPADETGRGRRGKLRLLFEAAPLGFLLEQAGGVATDGLAPILEVTPRSLHHQIPVVFGSPGEVGRFMAATRP